MHLHQRSAAILQATSGPCACRLEWLLVSVLSALGAMPASAQSDAQSASARARVDQERLGDAIEPEHAAGDWSGVRTRWNDTGVDVQAGYLAEVADVAFGGLRRGADYAHQIKLQADLDGQPLWGLDGLGLHTALINREGRSASADRLGDDLFQVQEIYGATDGRALHLSYAYAEYGAAQGAIDMKAGRLSVGQDFATSSLYGQYLSLGLCPQPRALSLEPAFSVVPSATWAARVRFSARARPCRSASIRRDHAMAALPASGGGFRTPPASWYLSKLGGNPASVRPSFRATTRQGWRSTHRARRCQ